MSQMKMSSSKPKKVKIKTSQKGPWKTFKSNWELLLLCMPAVICYILFNYVPMGGLILAFKNFRYDLGLFGSPWAGMANFDFLFKSVDLVRIVRNTVGYSACFIVVNLIANVGVALLLFEVTNRKALKAYQTMMTLPNFLSWVIVGFITYAIFNPSLGVLNQVREAMGKGNDRRVRGAILLAIHPCLCEYVERSRHGLHHVLCVADWH